MNCSTAGPVTTCRALVAVRAGAERDDLAPHDRLFARQVNGVEEGIDLNALPLPRDGGREGWDRESTNQCNKYNRY